MLAPLPTSKWNYRTAGHLLNRAGFGGTPAEIEKLAKLGPDEAVASLVDYERTPDATTDPEWARPEPDLIERYQKNRDLQTLSEEERKRLLDARQMEQKKQREHALELVGWWLQRMAAGPRPLQEKMTLFWHGHFATSILKVQLPYFMWRQNDIFRRNATGDWFQLHLEVGQDPAMLIWLDQAQSNRTHPNENYAREVMELFALGEGHYTEKDILEAARALTGWTVDRRRQEFVFNPQMHDGGVKTVLGATGNFKGEEVLKIIVGQPQSARFITGKLWRFFASEAAPDGMVDALADDFVKAGRNFRPVLRKMFRSEEFYADSVIGTQVKSPVQWLVSAVRMLEEPLPPLQVCWNSLRLLGQELLNPPNVKGWDGGLSWITTNNLLNRYNLAEFLVLGGRNLPGLGGGGLSPRMMKPGGEREAGARPTEVKKIIPEEAWRSKDALIAALEKRFLSVPLSPRQKAALHGYLDSQNQLDDGAVRHTIRLLMSTPEFQLT